MKPRTEDYWKKKLTSEQYKICRLGETETPFSGKYYKFKKKGIYVCVACKTPLFSSDTKFESETGWPSFYDVVKKGNVTTKTEVTCKTCGAHLGHVFEDGPQPTGLRYCINSVALDFKPKKE